MTPWAWVREHRATADPALVRCVRLSLIVRRLGSRARAVTVVHPAWSRFTRLMLARDECYLALCGASAAAFVEIMRGVP